MITADNIKQILAHRIAEHGSATIFAQKHGLSDAYVSLVASGKQKVGPKIARALGYRKIVRFEALQSDLADI